MANTEFRVGELIENRYRVLSVIETGGMGVLYRVSDEARASEIIALKTVRLDTLASGGERVERFQHEFQLLTQLQHPNLVPVYDYGVTVEGELYFTMEWIEEQDLGLGVRPLELTNSLPVIVQICRALSYLHARGVIHGDLKPANILIAAGANDGDWQVKIVDFGVALQARSREARAHYYTMGYSAPEIREQRPVDLRADLYSLGALWYSLLRGEPPLFMKGDERLIQFSLEETLASKGPAWAAVCAIIVRLTAILPQERYASANEVIKAINQATGSAYRLETQETARSYALRTHFVNREAEMATLREAWEQAKSGESKLVLVSGESGVGKTRLLEELKVHAGLDGARVVRGQCLQNGGNAYHPWREVLRVLIRHVQAMGLSRKTDFDITRVGPVLAMLLPELWQQSYMVDLAPPAELPPGPARERLNDALVQVLRAAAELRPTLIVIEDAHWADETTLGLLDFLTRALGPERLLVCATYRDDELEATHALETLSGERVQRVPLRRLSPQVTADLVRLMLGLEELPSALMERVQQTTEGNAFFVQELIRSLAEDGEVLQRTVSGWQVDQVAFRSARLPDSIHQVVWRRLEHLSPGARQVLQWASIVGQVFWESSVREIGPLPQAQIQAALYESMEHELIFERETPVFAGEQEYTFSNPTVREVSYESVFEGKRRVIHGRVAAWLIARSDAAVDEHLGLIAQHLEQAGQVEQAASYLRQAGEQAATQFANAEAIRYFERALDLTPKDERATRYALLLGRERVYGLQGKRNAQELDLAALQELAGQLDDEQPNASVSRRAEAALRRAECTDALGDYPATIAAAKEVIEAARSVRNASQEANGRGWWGDALWRLGEYQAAQRQLERGLELARSVEDRQVEANSLRAIGIIHDLLGDPVRAKNYAERALSIYRETDAYSGQCSTVNNLGIVAARKGDYVEASARWEQSLRIAREIGHRLLEGLVLGNLGEVSLTLGDYAMSRRYAGQALHIAREVGDQEGMGRTTASLGTILYQTGDYEAAREYAQQGLLIVREIGDRRLQADALVLLGHILVQLERLPEAAQAYRQAIDTRRELEQHHLITEPLAGLGNAALAQGDLEQAQSCIARVLDLLDERVQHGVEALVTYWNCYRVLRAARDSRAGAVLDTAYRVLQEQAARISDEEMRRSFLERVPVHREIVGEWANERICLE